MRPRELLGAVRARARRGSPPSAVAPALAGPRREELEAARRAYGGRGAGPGLCYGTVADLADSRERLPWLTGSSFDMKGLQRSWTLKEILASVEPPGPLLEIGAGEPLVADALARLGYAVTVVDPYDGTGSGPVEFERFVGRYPRLRFVRDRYPSERVARPMAAVYSISVLEHVPPAAAGAVARAASEQGARNIHAIDHVLRGWGDAEHHERLVELVGGLGIEAAELEEVLDRVERDPDAYFVSAEAHEVWRGATPYAEYSMRRICSVQLNVSA